MKNLLCGCIGRSRSSLHNDGAPSTFTGTQLITPGAELRLVPAQIKPWLCGNINVDHEHIFWNCPKISTYWDDVWLEIKTILSYEIPKTNVVLYLGNLTHDNTQGEDMYLVKILLAASKKAITRLWYKPEPPVREQWLGIVEEIFVMEKLTHKLRLQEDLFLEKWEKWTDYISQQNDTDMNNGHSKM